MRARAPPVQHIFRGGYKQRGLYAFQGGQRHHGCFGSSEETKEATAREPVLATSLWGMLYSGDAGVILANPRAAEEEEGGGRGSVHGV